MPPIESSALKFCPTLKNGEASGGFRLTPRPFEYFAPSSLEEAVSLLTKFKGEAKVLAGGQSLIPLMKLRIASPPYIVDINNIRGLEYVREERQIVMGSLTRMSQIETSSLLMKRYGLIPEAASLIADPLVRNMGTLGGNLSHGDPTNDMPAVMLAVGAEFVIAGADGERVIRAEDFFLDTFATALEPTEIMKQVRLPRVSLKSGGAYLKLERQAGDYAVVGVAAQIARDRAQRVERSGIGLTAVGPTAIKAKKAEELILGKVLTLSLIDEASSLASEESKPASDLRGSAEYKKEMVKVMTVRALTAATRRAAGA